jgi:ERCC4-related helicase
VNTSSAESPGFVKHPLIWKDSVEFRLYQKKIAESARYRNTMVILPTALGKTVISLLLCADMLYNYKDRRILIMAPTKPLVFQHKRSFFSVLKIWEEQIASVTGRTVPEARRAVWNERNIRLVFATPEVVKNDLDEDRLHLKDFSLLVFDEAHRAIKDYAYTAIAKEYINQSSSYHLILALTASPGAEKKRIEEICNNLSIEHIEYRSEDDPDVKPYINPVDVKWEWFNLPEEYQYIGSILRSMIRERLKWLMERGILRKKGGIEWIFKRDLIKVGEELRYILELTSEEQRGPLYIALMNQSSALTLMYCLELIESQGSSSLKAFLDRIEEEGGKTHASLLKDSRIIEIRTLVKGITKEHPKIQRLVQLIKEHHQYPLVHNRKISGSSSNSKILVFTQYRDTARHIVEVLARNGVNSSRFVGQAKRQGDEGMKQDEQVAILESFRNDDFNVLIATSIAEEGLDIPEVDLVVFYEPIPSEIRYIQRKGRTGRKSAGLVTILAANNTIDMRYLHASTKRVEKMRKSLNIINNVLKPISKTLLMPNPMSSEELSQIENRRRRLDDQLQKTIGPMYDNKNRLVGDKEIAKQLSQLHKIKRNTLPETGMLTEDFKRQVDRAMRRIYTELTMIGRKGLDIEILRNNLDFEYPVLIEALKKLEKLKKIERLDDSKVIAIDNLKQVSGKTYVISVGKVIQGRAIVTIDGKWLARLNHYDYDGPRELLKRGVEFRAIGELYYDEGVFSIRVKQIV